MARGSANLFPPQSQILQLRWATLLYVDLFLGSAGAVATLAATLVWLGPGRRGVISSSELALLLPAVTAFALYALVHLESRYIAPFAALLWMVPILAARWKDSPDGQGWLDRAALIAALFLTVPVAFHTASDAWLMRNLPNVHWNVAADLRRLGVKPGDRVAATGLGPPQGPVRDSKVIGLILLVCRWPPRSPTAQTCSVPIRARPLRCTRSSRKWGSARWSHEVFRAASALPDGGQSGKPSTTFSCCRHSARWQALGGLIHAGRV